MATQDFSSFLESEDVLNTLKVLKNLKIKIVKNNGYYEIFGQGGFFSDPQKVLHFGNSGTGVRLMTGLLSTSEINATLTGDKSLSSRPMKRIIDPLQEMNVSITHNNGLLPIKVFNHNNQHIPLTIL